MTPRDFRAWRYGQAYRTQKEAGDALGLSERTVRYYERGQFADGRAVVVPKTVRLAMAALSAGLRPAGES